MLSIKPVSEEVLRKYHWRGHRPQGWYFFITSELTGFILSIYTEKPLYIIYIMSIIYPPWLAYTSRICVIFACAELFNPVIVPACAESRQLSSAGIDGWKNCWIFSSSQENVLSLSLKSRKDCFVKVPDKEMEECKKNRTCNNTDKSQLWAYCVLKAWLENNEVET